MGLEPTSQRKETDMLWLVLLALLVLIAFGVGFVVHWLFVLAVVLALIWVIAFFAGGLRGGAR
jgi:hypothetical protein